MIRETGHAAGPGPVQAERFSEDYHGTHAKPAGPRAVPLDWHEATGRMEAARVLAHTCECRPVLLELCSRGGGHLIRRTTRTPGTRFRVAETSIMRAARAATRWQALLDGTAR
jgi:hypothetical protein